MNEVAGRTSGRDAFERVETLIPHKEPEWKPRQKLGKLDPRWHTWTAARKLGEYLLSSEQSPMLDELSRVCAAYLLEVEPEDLVAAGEGEGTDEEIQAKADRQAAAASKNIPWELKKILCEDDGAEKRGWLGPILQEAIRNVWGDEACREANRLYAEQDKDKHIAGVFDDKKQCDEAHRDAASSGYVARSFGHVEIDDDVDLAEYEKMALELEARFRSRELPQITPADHELRFRKCGRHRAIGVYNPLRRAAAVDPRAPSSPTPTTSSTGRCRARRSLGRSLRRSREASSRVT